jgi:N-acylneuraminate cytidylyltransferase/CMP-N,N'-diacetyllegionaminic acid synthase
MNEAIDIALTHDAIAVVSVSPTKQHPYISKRVRDDGTLTDYVPNDMTDLRRQALPSAYALNGAIYLISRKSLMEFRTFWPEGTYAHIMPPERSVDIDTPWDFHLTELVLRDRCERAND